MSKEYDNLPEDVKQEAIKRLAEKMGTNEDVVKKFAKLKIDQTPAMEEQYDRGSEYFSNYLDKIEPKELSEEIKAINETSAAEEDDERVLELEDRRYIMAKLRSIKNGAPKEKILEGLAKTRVFELNDVRNHYSGSKMEDILFQLDRAVYNLAQARFPKEFSKQEERRDKKMKEQIERKRDELNRMKVG